MSSVLHAVIHNGKLEFLGDASFPEGTRFNVVPSVEAEEFEFWRAAARPALDAIWENEADDIYAELDKE